MSDIQEIYDPHQIAELSSSWDALLPQTPRASFFHTWQWLETYWRHFGARQRLRLMVWRENGAIVGIIPLVIRRELFRMAPVRVLTYPLDDWGSFYGPIGPRPHEALRHAIEYVAHSRRDWDTLDLRWIDPQFDSTGADTHAVADALQSHGLACYERTCKRTAVVDLLGNWEDYLASRESKFRSEIRRAMRRTEKLGDVTYQRYRPAGEARGDSDPRWAMYDACVNLAQRSWQGDAHDGTTLSHDSVRDFLRDCHELAARLGMLDVNTLRIDGRLVAFAYNYHYQGYVYGLRVGYDPEFRKVGVGKMLWAKSIEDSFRRGDTLYDIGPDSLAVKRHWWTRLIPVRAVAHYPALSPRAQLIRATRWWHARSEPQREFADAEADAVTA